MSKKSILMSLCTLNFLYAASDEEILRYMETRKQQLEIQTREFDEAKQALEAYKASFEALQKQRLEAIIQKEAEVNASLAEIERLKAQNEQLLRQINSKLKNVEEKTSGKIKEIYSQMKDSAVADVLSSMDSEEASKIMLSLESRKISSVLAKMQPAKASELTLLLKNMQNDLNASSSEQ